MNIVIPWVVLVTPVLLVLLTASTWFLMRRMELSSERNLSERMALIGLRSQELEARSAQQTRQLLERGQARTAALIREFAVEGRRSLRYLIHHERRAAARTQALLREMQERNRELLERSQETLERSREMQERNRDIDVLIRMLLERTDRDRPKDPPAPT